MTRGEEFERLQFQAIQEKNDSLFDMFFHPDCTYESNLVATRSKGRGEENIMWETLGEEEHAGTQKIARSRIIEREATPYMSFSIEGQLSVLIRKRKSRLGLQSKKCNLFVCLFCFECVTRTDTLLGTSQTS